MSILFNSFAIGDLKIKNRFMRSATWLGIADADGNCTAQERDMLKDLAVGEIGLVTTGHIAVTPNGRAGLGQLTLYRDKQVVGLKDMVSAVHDNGAVVMAQLSHAGVLAAEKIIGDIPGGPSATDAFPHAHVLSEMEIDGITNSFAQAAYRAAEAGFDAIELHAAHGFLLSQFLSPLFNRRTDQYGGSPENRARIVVETIRKIKKSIGNACPVLVKLNSCDRTEGGLTVAEMLEIAVMLQIEGLDGIELSGGLLISPDGSPCVTAIKPYENEAYFKRESELLRRAVDIPLILVGGMRAFETMEYIVEEKIADMVSLSRPLIRQPHLVKQWQDGYQEPATCISCNGCFAAALQGQGAYCTVDKARLKD